MFHLRMFTTTVLVILGHLVSHTIGKNSTVCSEHCSFRGEGKATCQHQTGFCWDSCNTSINHWIGVNCDILLPENISFVCGDKSNKEVDYHYEVPRKDMLTATIRNTTCTFLCTVEKNAHDDYFVVRDCNGAFVTAETGMEGVLTSTVYYQPITNGTSSAPLHGATGTLDDVNNSLIGGIFGGVTIVFILIIICLAKRRCMDRVRVVSIESNTLKDAMSQTNIYVNKDVHSPMPEHRLYENQDMQLPVDLGHPLDVDLLDSASHDTIVTTETSQAPPPSSESPRVSGDSYQSVNGEMALFRSVCKKLRESLVASREESRSSSESSQSSLNGSYENVPTGVSRECEGK